jgi:hypothetical protein
MMFDRQTLFSNNQGPFNIGTNASTDYIDLQVARDIGRGKKLELVIAITEAVAGASGTCDFQLQTDDNTSFSTPTTIWSSGLQTIAQLGAAGIYAVHVPRAAVPERYLRLVYVVATTNQSAGKFFAGIILDAQDWILYPKAAYSQA